MEVVVEFAARTPGLSLRELGVGGGFAVRYLPEDEPPSVAVYAQAIVGSLQDACHRRHLSLPRLVVEPGRAIVARAGVALYTVGSWKDVPGIRRYVAVDGGMGDNIRPALYGSRYCALLANRPLDPPTGPVTVAGKFCESGDVLMWDVPLPAVGPGDILAVPAAGAYALAMASNYNASLRPAVVMVRDGQARLVRRRETYDDLLRCEVWP
jgi:diaminopimelate decarboxylase